MDGVAILETEVRELIRRRGIDPVRDTAGARALVGDAVADYDARSLLGGVPPLDDSADAVKSLVDTIAGLGVGRSGTISKVLARPAAAAR